MPWPITGASRKARVLHMKQQMCCFKSPQGRGVRNLRASPSLEHAHLPCTPLFLGELGLWYTDCPRLQWLLCPCCGVLGAFLKHELGDSSRLEQGSQSKRLVFPSRCRQSSAGLHVEPELHRVAEARSSCCYYQSRMLTTHFHVKTSSL